MKRVGMIILTLLLVISFAGCRQKIVLHQATDDVERIDLVYSPWGENEILYTLTEEEHGPFLENLLKIKLRKHLSPQDIGGSLYVQIVYSDGSAEILGDASVGYLSNGELEHDGWYYAPGDDLYDLFSSYVDISQLPYL